MGLNSLNLGAKASVLLGIYLWAISTWSWTLPWLQVGDPLLPCTPPRFYVNLLSSDQKDSETVLHFNPRLDESTVVFNTLEQGKWGKEERGKGIPFQSGQPFEVLLITTPEGFKVCLPPLNPPQTCKPLMGAGI